MKRPGWLFLALMLAAVSANAQTTPPAGVSVASVSNAETLDHTPQILTNDLGPTLREWKAAGRVVRLHVVAKDSASAALAWETLAKEFPPAAGGGPAITVVETALSEGARYAADATLISVRDDHRRRLRTHALKPGVRLFISGQAEKGDGSLPDATRATLQSLKETLASYGAELSDVAQVKAFFSPMTSVAVVRAEVDKFFAGKAPPLVLVEWGSPLIEIEWIAHGPPAPEGAPAVEYLTPPGMTASPVFSRLTRVNRGDLHFVAGLYGPEAEEPVNEVKAILDGLKAQSENAGSDLRHLVKATYYVASDGTSKALNELRPRYYDPKRPPAASKAPVAGAGLPGRAIVVDMVAVSKQP